MAERFQPEVIPFKGWRTAFARIHKAEARKGKDGKPKGDEKFSCTVLGDPSNKEHAATIAKIKQQSVDALNFRYRQAIADGSMKPFTVKLLEEVASGKRAIANFHLCWGYGNDLPELGKKVYDGFKDMFYLKLADKNRPNLLNRDGKTVVEGDPQCPYAGCYVGGTTTLYSYDNESRGVNANLRTLVFMRDGQKFGGGQENAEEAYRALGDLGDEDASGGLDDAGADPFAGL